MISFTRMMFLGRVVLNFRKIDKFLEETSGFLFSEILEKLGELKLMLKKLFRDTIR